jgi:hypothetical protein
MAEDNRFLLMYCKLFLSLSVYILIWVRNKEENYKSLFARENDLYITKLIGILCESVISSLKATKKR